MRVPLPVSTVAVEHIHEPAYRSGTTRCGIPHQAWEGAEERAPCGFEAILYAGSWIQNSQNLSSSTHFSESAA